MEHSFEIENYDIAEDYYIFWDTVYAPAQFIPIPNDGFKAKMYFCYLVWVILLINWHMNAKKAEVEGFGGFAM